MAKLVALISIFTFAFLTGIFILVFGWGLNPVDWWWIFNGFIVQTCLMILALIISESD